MTGIQKDIDITWSRLFNHKSFLQGEIQYTLREFEQNRKEREVFDLLYTLENISEIRDFELNRFVSNCRKLAPEINLCLGRVLDLCKKVPELEGKDFPEKALLEEKRKQRKFEKQRFLGDA